MYISPYKITVSGTFQKLLARVKCELRLWNACNEEVLAFQRRVIRWFEAPRQAVEERNRKVVELSVAPRVLHKFSTKNRFSIFTT